MVIIDWKNKNVFFYVSYGRRRTKCKSANKEKKLHCYLKKYHNESLIAIQERLVNRLRGKLISSLWNTFVGWSYDALNTPKTICQSAVKQCFCQILIDCQSKLLANILEVVFSFSKISYSFHLYIHVVSNPFYGRTC